MIKNERQYRITKAQADKFKKGIADLTHPPQDAEHLHPILRKAQVYALRSQLTDLETELAEYDALRSGEQVIADLSSFIDLPRELIRARIAAGLSQKDLADRLRLKEQQVQRYEATEYASASFARLTDVIRALSA